MPPDDHTQPKNPATPTHHRSNFETESQSMIENLQNMFNLIEDDQYYF